MARVSTSDPLDKFRFQVIIPGFSRLGFTSIETPAYTISNREYPEGGAHLTPRQIVDKISYKPVTLYRGVTTNKDFVTWARQPLNAALKLSDPSGFAGDLFNSAGSTLLNGTPKPNDYRKTVTINHLDRKGNIIKIYKLYNAFPIEFEPASNFDASSDDVISLEKLVLKYEGFSATDPIEEVTSLVKDTIQLF